ncbi:MAG: redoxin domain-containing protein, partial [Actinomycetota bacterium]|nr:redoxin domain-containing protein [Actinomycetota bacterium]
TALGGSAVKNVLGSHPSESLQACAQEPSATLRDCGTAPAISGIQSWFDTPGNGPLVPADLAGKVVLVDFWAYSCINCQRAIVHTEAWYSAYRAAGLVVVGVHTPEYAFEHVAGNIQAGARRLGITYPVAIDNNYVTWNNFGNNSWPASYLIDSTGHIRHVAIGEGDYSTDESLIRQLLSAAHPGVSLPPATGVKDTTPTDQNQTPESYLGAQRANSYAGGPLTNGTRSFTYPATVPQNAFALSGSWTVTDEALTAGAGAGIRLSFTAANVYLDVSGTGTLTVTVDGATKSYPVTGAPNIYTLVGRASPEQAVLTVTLSPGLSAYSFTFG